MRFATPLFLVIILGFIALIDSYTFRGIRILTNELPQWLRITIHSLYWIVPLILALGLFYIAGNMHKVFTTEMFRGFYFVTGLFFLFYIPKLVFIAFQVSNDLVRLAGFILSRLTHGHSVMDQVSWFMLRTEFLTKTGIVVAAVPFLAIIYGITIGRFNYQVKNVTLYFENLPEAFNGFKVMQISDWHIGSFYGHLDKVEESVDLINSQKADIILFTGDLVNNVAGEAKEFIPALSRLRAPYGVYSILGNHDYGEYVYWESDEAHTRNMQDLFRYEEESGMKLLRNDGFIIERNGAKIGIAGVENWGLPPFPQYGDLNKALEKIQEIPFKILMSHDPSHWDAEVRPTSNVDLTLSGHTHAMQLGINIPGLKWSPVQWKYPRWCGLYREGKQYLYVNVGIGYIGFPGRVGFLPEITIFELKRKV
jgi:predicted MPP superfamily phosphohydrolase